MPSAPDPNEPTYRPRTPSADEVAGWQRWITHAAAAIGEGHCPNRHGRMDIVDGVPCCGECNAWWRVEGPAENPIVCRDRMITPQGERLPAPVS